MCWLNDKLSVEVSASSFRGFFFPGLRSRLDLILGRVGRTGHMASRVCLIVHHETI